MIGVKFFTVGSAGNPTQDGFIYLSPDGKLVAGNNENWLNEILSEPAYSKPPSRRYVYAKDEPLTFLEALQWTYHGGYFRAGSPEYMGVTSAPLTPSPFTNTETLITHGGPGSGYFGHAGRPGEVGGSEAGGGGGGGEPHGHGHEPGHDRGHGHAPLGPAAVETSEHVTEIAHLAKGHVDVLGGLIGAKVKDKLEKATGVKQVTEKWRQKLEEKFGHAAPYLEASTVLAGWGIRKYLASHIGGHVGEKAAEFVGKVAGKATRVAVSEVAERLLGEEAYEKVVDKAKEVLGEAATGALPAIGAIGLITAYHLASAAQLHHIRQTQVGQKLGTLHEYARETQLVRGVTKGVHAVHSFIDKAPGAALSGVVRGVKAVGRGIIKGVSKIAEKTTIDYGPSYKPEPVGNVEASDLDRTALAREGADQFVDLFGQILHSYKESGELDKMMKDPDQVQEMTDMVHRWAQTEVPAY